MSLAQRPSHGGSSHRRVGAIIVAAGESRRMGRVDKIFATLLGKPLLTYAIDAFEACPRVEEVVLVLSPDRLEEGRHLAKEQGWKKVSSICQGGPRRQD